jgi:hypothetical protein
MSTVYKSESAISRQEWVRETRFGRWFLSTNIWIHYVLGEAVQDLGESCRPFIRSLPVRLLFKHPVEAQKKSWASPERKPCKPPRY